MATPMQGTRARKTPFTRDFDETLEAIRDDCIALFLNSKMTQQQIYRAGGPTPGTISKWLYKETRFPRFSTISEFTEALGCKLVIIDGRAEIPMKSRAQLRMPMANGRAMSLPERKKKGHRK